MNHIHPILRRIRRHISISFRFPSRGLCDRPFVFVFRCGRGIGVERVIRDVVGKERLNKALGTDEFEGPTLNTDTLVTTTTTSVDPSPNFLILKIGMCRRYPAYGIVLY